MQETEVIAKTDNVRVRIMTLSPHEIADWHYHTQVTDNIFCLTGTIAVRLQNPSGEVRLAPGQRCQIEKGRVHQLENCEDFQASYLLVQAFGKYDFHVVNGDRSSD
jgi:quercetin dioxygenase-like cupin family protein